MYLAGKQLEVAENERYHWQQISALRKSRDERGPASNQEGQQTVLKKSIVELDQIKRQLTSDFTNGRLNRVEYELAWRQQTDEKISPQHRKEVAYYEQLIRPREESGKPIFDSPQHQKDFENLQKEIRKRGGLANIRSDMQSRYDFLMEQLHKQYQKDIQQQAYQSRRKSPRQLNLGEQRKINFILERRGIPEKQLSRFEKRLLKKYREEGFTDDFVDQYIPPNSSQSSDIQSGFERNTSAREQMIYEKLINKKGLHVDLDVAKAITDWKLGKDVDDSGIEGGIEGFFQRHPDVKKKLDDEYY